MVVDEDTRSSGKAVDPVVGRNDEIEETIHQAISQELFENDYADVFRGDDRWRGLDTPEGNTFEWVDTSTYVRKAPYFDGMPLEPTPVTDIKGARVLALLGDSVTTDHISPAGSIKSGTPAAQYLDEHGVDRKDYNSLGSRRGNHEVMVRGTFANIRLRNQLLDDVSGGYTRDFTLEGGPQSFIYDASVNYQKAGIPLVVLGGKEYGSGSSRDWAAKGTSLLGVRAVIAQSYERIHRSNLIGMGILLVAVQRWTSRFSLPVEAALLPPLVGASWVVQEWVRSTIPWGGLSWARLAFSQAEAPTLAGLAVTLDDAEAEAQGIPGAGGLNGAVAAALAVQAAGSTTVDPDTTV